MAGRNRLYANHLKFPTRLKELFFRTYDDVVVLFFGKKVGLRVASIKEIGERVVRKFFMNIMNLYAMRKYLIYFL